MKTAIIFTPKYFEHETGRDHPESPARLHVIREELEKSGLLKTGRCSIVSPKPVELRDLELVHEADYIDLVRRLCKSGGGLLDTGDTVVSTKSFEIALLAVGGAVEAARLVAEGKAQNSFELVRPPGHHAGRYYALGFCIFNNIAVAAEYLLHYFDAKRILILDIDDHHGNGTQEIFYDTHKVLYVSLHHDPQDFPGTGFVDEVGDHEGRGYTVNIPFPFRTPDQVYLKAFDQIVIPIAQQYKPEYILVSVGFDGYHADPVGALALSAQIYAEVFSKILNLAHQACDGKLVATLEGGYHLKTLGKMATSVIAKLADVPYIVESKRTWQPSARIVRRAERVIDEVKRVQSSFWNLIPS